MTTIDNSLWEQFLLAPMYYIYWGIAIISSLVFTIQTIMLFVGFDTDADFGGGDVAFDVDGLATADVYLRIPADADKSGKVMVSYEGSLHELQAFNASAEDIPTGAKVHIVEAIDDATVRVERA